MKQILSLFIFLSAVLAASAQKAVVRAQLQDTMQKQQLSNATVSLINAADSSLIAFTRTDDNGNFYFDQLKTGKYRLSASQVNFHPQWKNFEITKGDEILELGTIYMKDKSIMEEVVVTNQRPPVVVNGDTLEFNAEAFKTKPNAVVEDMLKKMPGVEVDKEGNIKVNGKKISRVLVNGKDFFNGDPKMATKNLPADALDKVQVFEKQSDQAAFTGVDDGNSQTTLNLKLKKDKSHAIFGKVGAAAGTDGRYDGQFNLNKFNGDQQLSAIGMANNTNRQGFSFMDMLNFTGQNKKMLGGGSGGASIVFNASGDGNSMGLPIAGLNNSQGINQTIAGGLNYNDTWKKNTDVNASYFYNNVTTDNEKNVNRQNVLPGNNFTYLQNSNSNNKTQSNRFNFSIDHRIDSFNSVKLTSLIGYQKGERSETSNYESFVPDDKQLNNGFSNINSTSEGYTTENTLLYKHKFRKKGRTFSATASLQYNDSRGNSAQNSINTFFDNNGGIASSDTLNQQAKINSITQEYGINTSYTEPLSKRALLEFRGFYNTSKGDLERKTYDYNTTSGKYDNMNTILSNAFENRYNYTGGGASFRTQQKKYGFSVGANMQYAELKSHLKDSTFSIRQNFTNVLPLANFNYSFSKMKTIRMDYNTSTAQPSASQLQPVKNISDPLNITQGNPALKPSYTHNISLQFFNANPSKRRNMFAFVNYTATQNAIVSSDEVVGGARTTTPVNAGGVYTISGNVDRGFPVKKKARVGIGGSINYSNSVNFINGEKNNTGNLSFNPRLTAGYSYKDLFDIYLEARASYNEAKYSLQPVLNNNYWKQEYSADATLTLPKGFTIATDLTYTAYSGRAAGYNTNVALWNASISKQVFKSKKGEIKLSAFDLLKQNIGVDRNGNANYVEDVSYKVLQRYFTAGFTYSLQKASAGGPKMVIRRL